MRREERLNRRHRRHFLRRILTVAILAAVLLVGLPFARQWVKRLFLPGDYQSISVYLTHNMEEAGELTAMRYTDTGVMTNTTAAFLIGTVQKVTVPYSYEIGLGFPLSEVRLEAVGQSLTVHVPPIRMLYDKFEVTGKPEVSDFWYRLSETQYQKMLDAKSLQCRQEYTDNETCLQEARNAARTQLSALFSQWMGRELTLSFVMD